MTVADDKKPFSQWLEAAIKDHLYLGSSAYDLREEIANNMWRFHGSPEETGHHSVDKLKGWLESVIGNREQQLLDQHPVRRAIFYMWVDTQLAQLRFNLISDAHDPLPFGRRCNILQTPDLILHDFLARIGCEERCLNTDPDDWDEFLENNGLSVYAVALSRSVWHLSDWIKNRG